MTEAAVEKRAAPVAVPAAPAEPPPPPPTPMQRLARFTERFGHLMSRIVLTALYVVLVGPAGLVLSLFGDPLRIRRWRGTSWAEWTRPSGSLDHARRQD